MQTSGATDNTAWMADISQSVLRSGHVGDFFSYTPGTVIAVVGQMVELWPKTNDSHPRVFAVAPRLPRGLTIDKFTGLIHGTPEECTDGPLVYFVTACEPCADFNTSIAIIHVNVLSISSPGYPTAHHIQHGRERMPASSYPAPNVQTFAPYDIQNQIRQAISAQLEQALVDLNTVRRSEQ